jgi:hypothetical protein
MTPPLGCEAVRELAPELALGGLSGPERAAAIDHLVRCADCQAYVDELAAVADRLLLLAPEDEPSVGLETRVGVRIEELRPRLRRRRRWPVPLAAAAAVLIAAGSALAVHVADGGTTTGERQMRGAALVDTAHRRVGEAFIYNGSPSWVMVSVDHALSDGAYTIVCTGPHAGPLSWPNLRVTDGHGTIAWTAQGPVGGLDRVAVVDAAGHTVYTAALSAQAA